MNNIQTYEGFFDFLKKKEKKEVKLDEIMDCLYDLTDEHRIKNALNGDKFDGIFVDGDVVFGIKPSLSLDDDYDALMNDDLYGDKNFTVRKNSIGFNMTYSPNEISDSEVNEILLDCKSKLEIWGCKISFFIGWGVDEGSSINKEWTDFMKMINNTIKKTDSPDRVRNITIKITSPGGFN